MNDRKSESNRTKRLMSSGFDVDRTLREAGHQIAETGVSIRDLAPTWKAANENRAIADSTNVAFGWPRIALATSAMIVAAWLLIGGLSSFSTDHSDKVAIKESATINSDFTERMFSALSRKHTVSLNFDHFTKPQEDNGTATSSQPVQKAWKSLTQTRRISLDRFSKSLPTVEPLTLPKIRFRLMLDQ